MAAIEEYIEHHRDDVVTEKLNEIYTEQTSSLDPVLKELQQLSIILEEP